MGGIVMSNTPESLLEQLELLTVHLQKQVFAYDIELEEGPGSWLDILAERQRVIDQLSVLLEQGFQFSEAQKKRYLEKVYQMDQQLQPFIEEKMREIQGRLANLQKSKFANQQYNGYGLIEAYGSFFDKKK
jgi:predicted metal-dependent hydrolase